jgi:hypothetical protein
VGSKYRGRAFYGGGLIQSPLGILGHERTGLLSQLGQLALDFIHFVARGVR